MNTRTMKSLLMALLAVVLCVACGEKKSEYANVIPANSPLVISANLNSLGEKGSLKDYEGLIESTLTQVEQKDATLYQQLKAIVNDPDQLGLVLDAPVYLFALDEIDDVAAVCKVADKAKLTAFMKNLEKDDEWEYREEGELFWMTGPAAIAINEQLMIAGKNSQVVEKLLAQPTDESIVSTTKWTDMQDLPGDVKMYIQAGKLSKEADNPEVARIYQKIGIDLDQCSNTASFDFQNGKVVLHSKAYYPETLNELSKNMLDKIEGKHLEMIPGTPFICMTMNINMSEIFTFIEQILAGTSDVNDLAQIKPLAETIDGELTFAMNGFKPGSPIPDFTLFAEVKDRSLETMLSMILQPQMGISHGMIGDNLLYLTSNKEVAANPGKPVKSATNGQWKGKAKGNYTYLTLNLAPIRQHLSATLEPQKKEKIDIALNTIEGMEMAGNELQESQTTIHFCDKETNALKQLIQMGIKLSKQPYSASME